MQFQGVSAKAEYIPEQWRFRREPRAWDVPLELSPSPYGPAAWLRELWERMVSWLTT